MTRGVRTSGGYALVEAVLVVLVVSMTVPITMRALPASGHSARQAAMVDRAATLGGAVLEAVLADANSPAIGFDALGAVDYTDNAETGLFVRLADVAAPYQDVGLTYVVEVGSLTDAQGNTTGEATTDVYRVVTVRLTWADARGRSHELPMSSIVTDLAG